MATTRRKLVRLLPLTGLLRRLLALGVLLTLLLGAGYSSAQADTSEQELVEVLDALFAGDPDRIEGLLRFKLVPCAEEPMGIGPPPQCDPGGTDGTPVESFPTGGCEGGYARPDQMEGIVQTLSSTDHDVIAVYRYQPENEDGFYYGDYVAVADISKAPAPQNAGGVFIGDGGITGINVGCASTVEEFALSYGLTEQIDLTTIGGEPTEGAEISPPSTGTGTDEPINPRMWLLGALAAMAVASLVAGWAMARK